MRLFKLLQDYNGAVCSDAECSFKHKTIIHFNYVVLQKDTLFWAPSINTSCFAEKLPYDHTELHHLCPALVSKAPASYHHWDTTHALTCKHRLCMTVLYVPQHRTWKWGDECGGQDIMPRHGTRPKGMGLYDKGLVFTNISHTSFSFWPAVELVPWLPFCCLFFVSLRSNSLTMIYAGISYQIQEKHREGVCTEILLVTFTGDCSKGMYFSCLNHNAFYHIQWHG